MQRGETMESRTRARTGGRTGEGITQERVQLGMVELATLAWEWCVLDGLGGPQLSAERKMIEFRAKQIGAAAAIKRLVKLAEASAARRVAARQDVFAAHLLTCVLAIADVVPHRRRSPSENIDLRNDLEARFEDLLRKHPRLRCSTTDGAKALALAAVPRSRPSSKKRYLHLADTLGRMLPRRRSGGFLYNIAANSGEFRDKRPGKSRPGRIKSQMHIDALAAEPSQERLAEKAQFIAEAFARFVADHDQASMVFTQLVRRMGPVELDAAAITEIRDAWAQALLGAAQRQQAREAAAR